MADHLQRPHKKRPPPDAVEEPLSKRPHLEMPDINTPDIDDAAAAIEPRSQRHTWVPQAPKPQRLTKENLRLLNKMTRITKSDQAAGSKMASSSNIKTRSGGIISTTASGFEEQATANGILRPISSMPAYNAKETLERLNRSCETASPPESQYNLYCKKIDAAGNKAAVID